MTAKQSIVVKRVWLSRKRSLKYEVFQRDLWKCKICGNGNKDVLVVDHKKPRHLFKELINDARNLQTLCANCHMIKTKKEAKFWNKNNKSLVKYNKSKNHRK